MQHGPAATALTRLAASAADGHADGAPAGPSPRALRDAFGQYPTGVAVATASSADGAVIGMTINSFASLSLQPPLLLWSIGERSLDLPTYRDAARFGISVLSSTQEAVARHFADPLRRHTPDGAQWLDHSDGAPLVRAAIARMVCTVEQTLPAGDHLLIIGRVQHFSTARGAALVFHRGRYARTDSD